jgi:multiphosphoryl transfer protein
MTTEVQPLARDAIFLDRSEGSMHEAIDFVGGELVRRGMVDASYIDGMKKREESVLTYLGNGVSLPHGTFDAKEAIKGTAIIVAQYPDGIDWGGNEVHLVIGLAAQGDEHVQVLSQIAEVLQDEEVCEQLWTTDDADFVFETLAGDGTGVDDDDEVSDEVSRQITIVNPAGLHARPAALVVERAKGFDSDITISKNGKSANAKSIMSVLSLGAVTGDAVVVSAEGDDASRAVEDIAEIMLTTEEH